jgi:hypothetical protein
MFVWTDRQILSSAAVPVGPLPERIDPKCDVTGVSSRSPGTRIVPCKYILISASRQFLRDASKYVKAASWRQGTGHHVLLRSVHWVCKQQIRSLLFTHQTARTADGIIHYVYFLPNIRLRWARHVAPMWEIRRACKTLIRKSKENISVGRHSCIWESHSSAVVKEIEC